MNVVIARTGIAVGLSLLVASAKLTADENTNQVKSSAAQLREEAKQRRAKSPLAKGTLEAVDLLRHQLKVRTEDGPRIFTYTLRTYVFRAKDKITPDKLQVGETIAIRFGPDKDGTILVQRIKALGFSPPASATEPDDTKPLQ